MSSLISGLYQRIQLEKDVQDNDNDEMKSNIDGLVSFIIRNPDLTSEDVKVLAMTDKKEYKKIAIFFDRFPDIVAEIRKHGDKNLTSLIRNIETQSLASKLNEYIKNNKSKKKISIGFVNQYNYKHNNLTFIKSGESTIYNKSYTCISGSAGGIRRGSDLRIEDVAQIIGMVNFCMVRKITEKELRNIVKYNTAYNFSVISAILNATESISEELEQGNYGIIKLIEFYEYLTVKNKKENRV